LDSLLAELDRAARAEADQLLADAETRARAVEARARAEVERQRASRLAQVEAETRRALEREVAQSVHRRRVEVLEARARTLEKIFSEAARRLERLVISRYRSELAALVTATLDHLDGVRPALVCPVDAEAEVRLLLAGRTDVVVETSPAAFAGILGRSADGTTIVDNTFVGRLAQRRPDLAIGLAARLGGRA
jgi:vacuolar-type H+-ATPase subunit E/Vma4